MENKSVVPAQAGWSVVLPVYDDSGVCVGIEKDPVIAWAYHIVTSERHALCVHEDYDEGYALMDPNSKIHISSVRCQLTVSEYVAFKNQRKSA